MTDANIELTYKNQVVLLSAYYDKGPDNQRFVDMEQVKPADAIFLGHAHFDHMTEAARTSHQTGAPVYGHWTATETVRAQWEKVGLKVDEDQAIEVFDGDVFRFDGFTVEAIHMLHSGEGEIQAAMVRIGGETDLATLAYAGGPEDYGGMFFSLSWNSILSGITASPI